MFRRSSTCENLSRPCIFVVKLQIPCLWLKFLLDPTPACGITSSGPLSRGQNVTLACSMTYYYESPSGTRPVATISASIGWQLPTGAFTENFPSARDGETLQINAWTVADETEIPSYNCVSTFYFSDNRTYTATRPQVALNSVSWTCTSKPVPIPRT